MKAALGAILVLMLSSRSVAQEPPLIPNAFGYWDCQDVHFYWDGMNMSFYAYGEDFFVDSSEVDTIGGVPWMVLNAYGAFDDEPAGWIREEGTKVLFRYHDHNGSNWVCPAFQDPAVDYVLYDFGLEVGDTAYYYNGEGSPVTVQSIDTVLLDGVPRKRLIMSSGLDEWIQGMGSVLGILYPLRCWFENFYQMVSFCGSYVDSSGVGYELCWQSYVGLKEDQRTSLTVHPNPTRGLVTLRTTEGQGEFMLLDLSGRVMLRDRLRGPESAIDLSGLSPGIYVLRWNGAQTRVVVE